MQIYKVFLLRNAFSCVFFLDFIQQTDKLAYILTTVR